MLEVAKRPSLDEMQLKDAFVFLRSEKSLEMLHLAGDASSRSYVRILTSSQKSYVLQIDSPFVLERAEEHPYLSALLLFQNLTGAVPKLHGFNAERGWILLEDLGDCTLQKDPRESFYFDAITLMNRWVCGGMEYRQNFGVHSGPHFKWAFDYEKLNFEMEHTAQFLVKDYLKKNATEFLECVNENTNYLVSRPRYLCHRDYHCRNLMVHQEKLWVIDFQDARMGPLTYDLVSLLWDPYVRLEKSFQDRLLKFWQEDLLKGSHAEHFKTYFNGTYSDSWLEELERMKIQRLLKAAGSYASFLVKKGRRDYLPGIAPALTDSIESLEKLKTLGRASANDDRLLTLLQEYLLIPGAIIKNG